MPIAREILSMFEFSRNQKNTFSVDNYFDGLIESHRKVSIALWVHPFNQIKYGSISTER